MQVATKYNNNEIVKWMYNRKEFDEDDELDALIQKSLVHFKNVFYNAIIHSKEKVSSWQEMEQYLFKNKLNSSSKSRRMFTVFI